jgi:thiol:disulfide interchange protein
MLDMLIRLGILALVVLLILAIVWIGRAFVAQQRRLALAAAPLADAPSLVGALEPAAGKVRILAFSSETCIQCHTQQLPALQRLQKLRGEQIEVVEIDAPAAPDLVKRYHVLTVPSTVVLDPEGQARAVNYGFANTGKLREQVDAVLALTH